MNTPIFTMKRSDKICRDMNRERPKHKSTWVSRGSKCIVFDESTDYFYPMSYVLWADILTGESGLGWVLRSSLDPSNI
jgi:hypothetical protein